MGASQVASEWAWLTFQYSHLKGNIVLLHVYALFYLGSKGVIHFSVVFHCILQRISNAIIVFAILESHKGFFLGGVFVCGKI